MAVSTEVISVSRVVSVVAGERPRSSASAREGIRAHNRITHEIERQPDLVFAGFESSPFANRVVWQANKGRRIEGSVCGVRMSAIPDVVLNEGEACVEIKPRFSELHLLQLALTCTVVGAGQGAVPGGFLYYYARQFPRTNYISADLFKFEREMASIASLASSLDLMNNRLEDDKSRRGERLYMRQVALWSDDRREIMSRDENVGLQNEMVKTRREMDSQVIKLLSGLSELVR